MKENPKLKGIRGHNKVMFWTVCFSVFTVFVLGKDYLQEERIKNNKEPQQYRPGAYLKDYR